MGISRFASDNPAVSGVLATFTHNKAGGAIPRAAGTRPRNFTPPKDFSTKFLGKAEWKASLVL